MRPVARMPAFFFGLSVDFQPHGALDHRSRVQAAARRDVLVEKGAALRSRSRPPANARSRHPPTFARAAKHRKAREGRCHRPSEATPRKCSVSWSGNRCCRTCCRPDSNSTSAPSAGRPNPTAARPWQRPRPCPAGGRCDRRDNCSKTPCGAKKRVAIGRHREDEADLPRLALALLGDVQRRNAPSRCRLRQTTACTTRPLRRRRLHLHFDARRGLLRLDRSGLPIVAAVAPDRNVFLLARHLRAAALIRVERSRSSSGPETSDSLPVLTRALIIPACVSTVAVSATPRIVTASGFCSSSMSGAACMKRRPAGGDEAAKAVGRPIGFRRRPPPSASQRFPDSYAAAGRTTSRSITFPVSTRQPASGVPCHWPSRAPFAGHRRRTAT